MLKIQTKKGPGKGLRDVFALCDLPGFATLASSVDESCSSRSQCKKASNYWNGKKTYDEALAQVTSGDLSGVAESDGYMSKIEHVVPVSQAWRNVADVVGGVPNVPAYLAGHPLNMRRRQRVMAEQSPITVFVSLELSAGIDVKTMRKRGAAILALTRALTNARPVDLYACISVGGNGIGEHVLIKIDTAPLDLARAAHVLTDPCVTRGLGYASAKKIGQDELHWSWGGHWAYGDESLYRRTALDNFKAMTGTTGDAILMPAAHVDDPSVKTPEVWLIDMLKKYGGMNNED